MGARYLSKEHDNCHTGLSFALLRAFDRFILQRAFNSLIVDANRLFPFLFEMLKLSQINHFCFNASNFCQICQKNDHYSK